MTTIQLPIEEPLLSEIDRTAQGLSMTRDAFIQVTLWRAMQRKRRLALELQDIQGYRRQPQTLAEVEEWLPEQDWGDE